MLNSLENENKILREENEKLKQQLKISEHALIQKDRYYQQLIDNIPVHIYTKNVDGTMSGCNKANLESTKFNKVEDVIGKTEDEISINKEFSDIIKANDADVLANGGTKVFEEVNRVGGKEIVYFSTKVV